MSPSLKKCLFPKPFSLALRLKYLFHFFSYITGLHKGAIPGVEAACVRNGWGESHSGHGRTTS